MDDATFAHLQAWADRNLNDEEREGIVDAILILWAGGDDEDRERWAGQGWPHIAALVGAEGF